MAQLQVLTELFALSEVHCESGPGSWPSARGLAHGGSKHYEPVGLGPEDMFLGNKGPCRNP